MLFRSRTPQEQTPPLPEPTAAAGMPISFTEPAGQPADGAVIADERPAGFVDPPLVSPAEFDALHAEAYRDNAKRDFVKKVMAARAPEDSPPVEPPPVAPRVQQQTLDELAAGRAMVAKHAAQQSQRTPHEPVDAGAKAVFRPADYVPDMKKGQGYVAARPV